MLRALWRWQRKKLASHWSLQRGRPRRASNRNSAQNGLKGDTREILAHVTEKSLGKSGSSSSRICLSYSALFLSGRPSATAAPAAPGSHPSRFKSTVKGALLSGLLWPEPRDLLWLFLIGPRWGHRDVRLWLARRGHMLTPGAGGLESTPPQTLWTRVPRSKAWLGGSEWENENQLLSRIKQMFAIESCHYSSALKNERIGVQRDQATPPKSHRESGRNFLPCLTHDAGSPAAVSWKVTIPVCILGKTGSRKDVC